MTRNLDDAYDLAAEFFVWEFATAVAGWRLGINPFDQPNVQESKDATRELLDYFKTHGELQEQEPLIGDDTLTVYAYERCAPGLLNILLPMRCERTLRQLEPATTSRCWSMSKRLRKLKQPSRRSHEASRFAALCYHNGLWATLSSFDRSVA